MDIKLKQSTSTSKFGTSGRSSHDSTTFYSSKMYNEIVDNDVENIVNVLPTNLLNKIINKSSEAMDDIPNSSIHLMVTSPPYNVSKDYDDDLSLDEYLNLLKKCFTETYRVLVNGGRACINIANIGRKPYIPLSDYISKIMIDIGFNMRGEIIWNKSAGAGSSTAWGSFQSASNPTLRDVHEYILIFSKGSYKRERDKLELEIKKNSISKENFIEWTKSIWNMNTESAKRIGHPAPFPIELPYRLIQLLSFENDIVLDPFMGSGTSAVAALNSNRCFIGYEISNDYITLANERIRNAQEQSLLFKTD